MSMLQADAALLCRISADRYDSVFHAQKTSARQRVRNGLSSCQVNTLHLARRVADRMQRTMPYQSSSKSGRRASSNVQKSRSSA